MLHIPAALLCSKWACHSLDVSKFENLSTNSPLPTKTGHLNANLSMPLIAMVKSLCKFFQFFNDTKVKLIYLSVIGSRPFLSFQVSLHPRYNEEELYELSLVLEPRNETIGVSKAFICLLRLCVDFVKSVDKIEKNDFGWIVYCMWHLKTSADQSMYCQKELPLHGYDHD